MIRFLKYSLLTVLLCLATIADAQTQNYREMHKVKKGETIFGIAKKYEISIKELIKANPDMNSVGYELKKGDYIFIPYSTGKSATTTSKDKSAQQNKTVAAKTNTVKVGIMLPLHNVDGDGRRMVEYYRGILMGCDKLKKEGINIDIKAWNVAIDTDINQTLSQQGATDCDVIFGPLYSKQVPALSEFTKKHGIKLVIPFSITGNDVAKNPNIFQVYQSPEQFYGEVVKQFTTRFSGSHVVVVDCNDKQSDKGVFTFTLRKALANKGMTCSITNITNSDESFAKAFSTTKPNIVVLNTARSPELNAVIAKLDKYKATMPSVKVSLFGYTEWLMYAKYNMDKFCKYDTCVPSHFYYNPLSTATKDFSTEYLKKFDQSMMDYMPRFAITGYDHAMFFIRGISKQGKLFNGTEPDAKALQAQLKFRKADGQNSGMQNHNLMFVHYNTNKTISIIQF
ncbi:ABC transporter substrate-binding protein [uncultured Prevotella sp.]|uniref:ABC transporter substrate-binding protein n=1 Tax=uncultured Prevotella sp. TaxID=159272 RepID=UPI0026118D4B|nr:ABC transporter substrate-binding protein [uncultured Prevotella sp.]